MDEQEERQRLIDSFVNSVYLYDDKCVITFNYKDGTKTITLKDIEGSNLFASSAVMRIRSSEMMTFFLFKKQQNNWFFRKIKKVSKK